MKSKLSQLKKPERIFIGGDYGQGSYDDLKSILSELKPAPLVSASQSQDSSNATNIYQMTTTDNYTLEAIADLEKRILEIKKILLNTYKKAEAAIALAKIDYILDEVAALKNKINEAYKLNSYIKVTQYTGDSRKLYLENTTMNFAMIEALFTATLNACRHFLDKDKVETLQNDIAVAKEIKLNHIKNNNQHNELTTYSTNVAKSITDALDHKTQIEHLSELNQQITEKLNLFIDLKIKSDEAMEIHSIEIEDQNSSDIKCITDKWSAFKPNDPQQDHATYNKVYNLNLYELLDKCASKTLILNKRLFAMKNIADELQTIKNDNITLSELANPLYFKNFNSTNATVAKNTLNDFTTKSKRIYKLEKLDVQNKISELEREISLETKKIIALDKALANRQDEHKNNIGYRTKTSEIYLLNGTSSKYATLFCCLFSRPKISTLSKVIDYVRRAIATII